MNSLYRPTQTLLLTVFCHLACSFALRAQFLQVTDAATAPYTPQNLISNVFLGDGVQVTNIQFNGDNKAVGYFSGGGPSIGIDRGIILTSGRADEASDVGATWANNGNFGGSNEPDLDQIASDVLNDVAVYTITFIPNADTLRFRYSFASEEYPEFACTDYNDVFGFFIQGPGYPTFTNIALIPGTNDPVAINNLHPQNPNPVYFWCTPLNAQYYNDNESSSLQPVYDGFTDVFTAMAVVTPCQPYTIKLAIADVGDSSYDSGVFLEAKSFGTGSLRVDVATSSADGTLAEGCAAGTITFNLPQPRAQNFPIVYNVFGSATPGLDFTPIPANLSIPAGQTTLTVPISALEDNLPEGTESISISVQVDPCNRDTVFLFIRDNILLAPQQGDTSVCLPNSPVQLNASVPTPMPPAPIFTNTQDFPVPNNGTPIKSTVNAFGVLPTVLGPGMIRSVCMNVTHDWVSDVDAYLISPGGQVVELTTDNGADGNDYTNTCFTPTATTVINFPGPYAPASAAPFTGDWLPEGPWSDLYGGASNGVWTLQVSDDQNNINGILRDWSITFEPSYSVDYAWSPATGLSCTDCSNPVVTVPQTTVYSVTATDSYGCSVVANDIEVSVGELAATLNVQQPILCFGQKATLQVSAPGNNSYLWSTNQTSATISNLGPGTYTVTVSSIGASCSATASVTLTQPDELFAVPSPHNVTCFGLLTGTAAVYPSGGTGPYSFLWSNGMTADSIFGLAPGVYGVTVTDVNGCQKMTTMNVAEPAPIQILTALNRSPSCFGLSDGQLTTYAVGGTTPFEFVWNTGQVNQGITNIPAGTYTVTATDGNGCSQVKTEVVTEPALLTSMASAEAISCYGENTGKAHAEAVGGTPQYTIKWSGPNGYTSSGANISNLLAGQYTVTVTDTKGCSSTATTTIVEPPLLVLDMPDIADTVCFSASDGAAIALPQGGTAPYTYLWDAGGQTTQVATGLSVNEYQVTVTDAGGCTATGKTFVQQLQELNAYAESQLPGCHNGSDATASVISIFYGATAADLAAFTYVWNTTPPQIGPNAIGLRGGQNYLLTATDALGCTATVSVEVGNPLPIETSVTGFADARCFGDATGWAAARADGGSAPYTWLWNGGTSPTDSVAQGLMAGNYRVTITDANGCPGIASVTIGEPSELRVNIASSAVKCFGGEDGSAKAVPSGGTPGYQFVWANGVETAVIQGLSAGLYTMSVIDANGCTTPAAIEIMQPAEGLSGVASMEPPRCHGGHDGRILLTGNGGTAPYLFAIDNKPPNGSPVQIGIPAGVYTPKIIDKNGCEFALPPIEVTQPDPLVVDLGPDFSIVFGQDTQLFANVQGAHGALQYAWALEDSTWLACLDCRNPAVYSLEFPTYFELLVLDSLGCRAEDQILISVEKPRKVFVPTGFTPNGDFFNDLLLVHGQRGSKAVEFRIFDRWGEMLFQLEDFDFNDEAKGWDGSFRGQPCDPGVYIWVLEVEYVDGVREVFKGNTTLIR